MEQHVDAHLHVLKLTVQRVQERRQDGWQFHPLVGDGLEGGQGQSGRSSH